MRTGIPESGTASTKIVADLKKIRDRHNFSNAEIARLTDYSREYVSAVLHGRRKPSMEFAEKVSKLAVAPSILESVEAKEDSPIKLREDAASYGRDRRKELTEAADGLMKLWDDDREKFQIVAEMIKRLRKPEGA